MELNHDTQNEHFNCQEEFIALTDEYILSTLSITNIWAPPLTIFTQQTADHTKTSSPPHLEIDFLIESGATLNVLNKNTWKEIKECHKL